MEKRGVKCPNIFGDPALFLPKFYKPKLLSYLTNKIGIIPHKSNYNLYKNKKIKSCFHLISPTDKWQNVINQIYSCKYILSLDEYKIKEGDFKFKDYFQSQSRPYIKITSINNFNEKLLYKDGNKINRKNLLESFPFGKKISNVAKSNKL